MIRFQDLDLQERGDFMSLVLSFRGLNHSFSVKSIWRIYTGTQWNCSVFFSVVVALLSRMAGVQVGRAFYDGFVKNILLQKWNLLKGVFKLYILFSLFLFLSPLSTFVQAFEGSDMEYNEEKWKHEHFGKKTLPNRPYITLQPVAARQ